MKNTTRNLWSILAILVGIFLIIYGIFLLYRGNEKIENNESTEGNVALGGVLVGLGIAAIILTFLFSLSNKPAENSFYTSQKKWQNILLIFLLILVVAGIGVGGWFLLKNV